MGMRSAPEPIRTTFFPKRLIMGIWGLLKILAILKKLLARKATIEATPPVPSRIVNQSPQVTTLIDNHTVLTIEQRNTRVTEFEPLRRTSTSNSRLLCPPALRGRQVALARRGAFRKRENVCVRACVGVPQGKRMRNQTNRIPCQS